MIEIRFAAPLRLSGEGGDNVHKALWPLLVSVVDGVYLILRFFRRKALLNLMVGFGVIAVPAFIAAVKAIADRMPSDYAGIAIAIVITAAFAIFSYFTALALVAVRSQWDDAHGDLKPTPAEIASYAIGAVAAVVFSAMIFL